MLLLPIASPAPIVELVWCGSASDAPYEVDDADWDRIAQELRVLSLSRWARLARRWVVCWVPSGRELRQNGK